MKVGMQPGFNFLQTWILQGVDFRCSEFPHELQATVLQAHKNK
jgi:hypothetical protein